MSEKNPEQLIEAKMRKDGIEETALRAFLHAVQKARSGEKCEISEDEITAVTELPRLEDVACQPTGSSARLDELVVIKLNGGLGTTMGLDRAKSLLPVKGDDTFLDFIARQILHLRANHGGPLAPRFYFMNSFHTRKDTLDYLRKYPELWQQGEVDFLQGRAPKLHPETYEPFSWPDNPALEWHPTGHGDIYRTLSATGLIDQWLQQGIKYMFVSNADNLAATVDLPLLHYFASSGFSFLMEVAERTKSDVKGGHLARCRSNQRLVLRETKQCPERDIGEFQNIEKHRFFNTNNLWIRLADLKSLLQKHGGWLPLPVIVNRQHIDPTDKATPIVLQLESAMGAAIEFFDNANALVVPRSRFIPVKTNEELQALRSDAYKVTGDFRLAPAR